MAINPKNPMTDDDAIQSVQLAEYQYIDDNLRKKLEPDIERWKEKYDKSGGIHLLDVTPDEGAPFNGIFRLFNQAELENSSKAKKSDFALGRVLLRKCVLYPSPDVLDDILDRDFGLTVPLLKRLTELRKITLEATAKKL
jgi:hypothetical protein